MASKDILHPCARFAVGAACIVPIILLGVSVLWSWPWVLTTGVLLATAGAGVAMLRICLKSISSGERGLRSVFGVVRDELDTGICLTVPGVLKLQKYSLRETSLPLKSIRVYAAGGVPVDVVIGIDWKLLPEHLADVASLHDVRASITNQVKSSIQAFVSLVTDSGDLVSGSLKEALSTYVLEAARLRAEGRVSRALPGDWKATKPIPQNEEEQEGPWGVWFINVTVTDWTVPAEIQETAIRREANRLREEAHASFSKAYATLCGELRKAGIPAEQIPPMAAAYMSPDASPLPPAPDTNVLLQDGFPVALSRTARADYVRDPSLEDMTPPKRRRRVEKEDTGSSGDGDD